MKKIILVLIIVLAFVISAPAQVYQQVAGAGTINWQDQVIKSTGIGAPNPNVPMAARRAGALEAAKRVALRNLLETVKGMAITSETTVENAMMVSDVINTQVQGAVRNFRVVDTRYMSSGDVEVDVEVPLSGVLTDALLPQQDTGGMLLPGSGWGGNYAAPAQPVGVVTGLIIDARGAGVRPAMAPKIVDQKGNEVYGSGYVSREYAVQIGVVGYEKDLNRAKSNERVTDTPMIVKAVSAAGSNQSDIVISDSDAQRIVAAAKNMNFMEQCKVMVILD
jgi:hypothetical protein